MVPPLPADVSCAAADPSFSQHADTRVVDTTDLDFDNEHVPNAICLRPMHLMCVHTAFKQLEDDTAKFWCYHSDSTGCRIEGR